MAIEVATAYVSVVPSAKDFTKKLRSQIGTIPTISVPMTPNTRGFARKVAQAAAAGVTPVKVPITTDAKAFTAKLNGLTSTVRIPVVPNVGNFNSSLRGSIGNQSGLGNSMGSSAGESMRDAFLSAARRIALEVGAILAVKNLIGGAESALHEAADFETTRVAMEGILGDTAKANDLLSDLFEFAKVTPFDFPDLSDAARKLLAFGFTADSIIPTMTKLGDAAAALGASSSDINLVTRALGQIAGKGRVQLEEINQLAEALPGFNPLPALAASVGVSNADFQTALSEPGGALKAFGLTGKQAVDVIIEAMAQVPGAAGAMDRQLRTLKGSYSDLADTARKFGRDLVEPFRPFIVSLLLDKIAPALSSAGATIPVQIAKITDAFKAGFAAPDIVSKDKGFSQFFANLGGLFAQTAAFVKLHGGGVVNALSGFVAHIARFLNGPVYKALKVVPSNIAKIVDAFRAGFVNPQVFGTYKGFSQFFANLGGLVKRFFTTLDNNKNKINSAVGGTFSKVAGAIAAILNKALTYIQAFTIGLKGVGVPEGLKGVQRIFANIGDFIKKVIDGWKFFKAELKGADGVPSGLGGVAGFMAGLGDAIDRIAGSFKDGTGRDVINWFKDKVPEALNNFVDGFKGVDENNPALSPTMQFIRTLGEKLDHLLVFIRDDVPPALHDLVEGFKTGAQGLDDSGINTKIGDLGETLGKVVKFVDEHPALFAGIATGLAGVAAVKFTEPGQQVADFTTKIVNLGASMSSAAFANPEATGVVLAIAAVGTAAVVAYQKWKPFHDFVDSLGGKVKDLFTDNPKLDDVKFQVKAIPLTAGPLANVDDVALLPPPPAPDKSFTEQLDKAKEALENWFKDEPKLRDKIRAWSNSISESIRKDLGPAIRKNGPDIVKNLILGIGDFQLSMTLAFLDLVGALAISAVQLAGSIVGLILDTLQAVVAGIGKTVVDAVTSFFGPDSEWWSGAKEIWNWVSDKFGEAIDFIQNNLLGWLKGIADAIGNYFVGSNVWGWLSDGFKAAIDLIISLWNKLDFSITVPELPGNDLVQGGYKILLGPLYNLAGKTIHFGKGHADPVGADIPFTPLASGAVFTQPTKGMFELAETGRAQPEIITPHRLLVETFRAEIARASSAGVGGSAPLIGALNVMNPHNSNADEIADAVHAKLAFALTTRGDR